MQSRWAWKRTYGQGSTMERSNKLRRPAVSARTTRKEGANGCKAQRGASDRGSNPTRQDLGQGTKDNPRPVARVVGQHVTLTWDSEEHWRELRATEAHVHSEDHQATHPEGQGAQRSLRQRFKVHPRTDQ